MSDSQLEELIYELVGPGEASPFELAGEICDVSPSNKTRKKIAEMVSDRKLDLTEEFFVRLPNPVSST
jgi:hypothetical protein